MTATRIFVSSAVLQLRTQGSGLLLIAGVVQPLALLAVALVARRGGHHVDAGSLALGISLVGLWSTTIWTTGYVLVSERWQGTLAPLLARPASLALVLAGKSAGSTLRSALFVVPTVLVGAALAGQPVPVHDPLLLAAAAVAVLASAAVLGMLVSCLFVVTRAAPRVAEAATYPVFIVGGLVVPLSLLPHWLRPLSAVVSFHWGAELLHAASSGAPAPARAWAMLGVTTALYAALAAFLFDRMVDRGRRNGTLELF